ncbi:hypothetical protein [Algoriphagus resistens]|uniref:hypothetical protein n=1 Tax=Algoriphagus resistens TaxID=1750590 RepID=UPI00071682B7|nr:hypothetical protein [Algoriphagus resistens]
MTEAGAILNFGIVEVPIDFGNALITPETPVDKVLDFFLRRDIDFKENKEFSDKFYLIGTNKNLLRSKITPAIQNQLLKTPKIEVEINRTKVLEMFDNTMTIKRTLAIADLLKKFKI